MLPTTYSYPGITATNCALPANRHYMKATNARIIVSVLVTNWNGQANMTLQPTALLGYDNANNEIWGVDHTYPTTVTNYNAAIGTFLNEWRGVFGVGVQAITGGVTLTMYVTEYSEAVNVMGNG